MLKKPNNLDVTDVKSYRPISNHVGPIQTHRVPIVAKQLIDYLKSAQFFSLITSLRIPIEPFDSCSARSIAGPYPAADRGDLSALVLLDLLVAFDTGDVLLKRLDMSYGVTGCALKWFQSLNPNIHELS